MKFKDDPKPLNFEVTRDDKKTFLIPNIKDCVKKVDVTNKKMTIKKGGNYEKVFKIVLATF